MDFNRMLMIVALVAILAATGCAGSLSPTEPYPTPMPGDLPVGLDEGLIRPGWDGGHPLRLLAFFVHPLGVGADLLINQPIYFVASRVPEVFGYTVQDANYREAELRYRYHWLPRSLKPTP